MANSVVSNQTINPDEYEAFRQFLEQACGIVLGENKQYLVINRLDSLMRELSLISVRDLIEKLKNDRGSKLRERVIDAMTTNETSWFRDIYPFEILKQDILPQVAKQKKRELRIWSAACSSGQEPYSISMIVQEFVRERPAGLSFSQIVSTDISPAILQSAREGLYDHLALSRGLSQERKNQFFTAKADRWQIKPEIRDRIVFKELNLMESFMMLGRFDVVFCRNVLIYFSESAKADIIRRITRTLQPDGYLFLGGSESLTGFTDEFEILKAHNGLVYKLKSHPKSL